MLMYVMGRNCVTKIRPMRVESLHADRQTDMKMMVTLRKFAQGPKKIKDSETTEMTLM